MDTGTSGPRGSTDAASVHAPDDGNGNGEEEMAPLGDTLNAARRSRGTSTSAGEQHARTWPSQGWGQRHSTSHQKDKCHLRTKTSIKIAGLNIRGHGSTNIEHAANKWGDIRLMMLDRRIGILVIGEAHMNADRQDDIDRKYGKDI
ncbi:hypothetical protein EV359DRAFT_87185 [Lentinula novae-zelandiae]|nr:hypothetical protein EV359DRAFT_87185 [Lentinula novae-zelandiae]